MKDILLQSTKTKIISELLSWSANSITTLVTIIGKASELYSWDLLKLKSEKHLLKTNENAYRCEHWFAFDRACYKNLEALVIKR